MTNDITKNMAKGIIFDVDGVLLDSMSIWMDAAARYLQSIGVQPKEKLGEIMWSMSISEGAAYLKKEYWLPYDETVITQGVLDTIRDFYYDTVQLKPGVKALLAAFWEQNIPMVIATSGEKSYVEKAFSRLEIAHYFKGIVTPVEAGAGKTSPLIYRMAAALLQTAPEETLVFEDALYALQTAKAAGFQTVGVYDFYSEKDQEELKGIADYYVRTLEEIDRKKTRKLDKEENQEA